MNRQLRILNLLDQLHDVPAERQAAFLNDACGSDNELRREVESMLVRKREANDLFETLDPSQSPTPAAVTHSESGVPKDLRLRAGQLLGGRYEIQSTLGHGGMGEVYCAVDLRLGREVAIKILNTTALRSEQMHDRFERELRSVAALSHPNVVTLFDVVSDEDFSFAVMELIAGKTLRDLIQDRLTTAMAIRIGRDIADGIAAAHQCNIMHRDIKPENIMITPDGTAKVLDFGIARSDSNDDQVTLVNSSEMTPGTPPYMSPEQANGDDIDCSTDVFSLGTVLFEMIAGINPFRGKTIMKTLQNVCDTNRPRIADHDANISNSVASLVDSMLQIDPADRPSIDDVRRHLQSLDQPDGDTTANPSPARIATIKSGQSDPETTDASSLGGRPSIAIMPLAAVGKDSQDVMFGDAISHEVIVELSKLHSLAVIARGSSFQFRGPEVDLADVGRVLAVKYALTGTIDVQDSRCSVSIELSRTEDQAILWTDRFSTPKDNMMQLRDQISFQVVSAIESQVQIAEAHDAMRLPTDNLDAWSAYHRGLWHMYRFNSRDNEIAAGLFGQAVDLDLNFAKAHAGLSFTHFQQAFLKYSDNIDKEQRLARHAAETALQLDPSDPFINLTMGRTEWLLGNMERAAGWMDQSLQLSPSYAFATYNRGLIDAILNDGQKCQQAIEKALALSPIDPLGYAMHCTLAFSHLVREQYQQAVDCTERAIRAPTAHIHIFLAAAMSNELNGDADAAQRLINQVRQMDPSYTQDDFLRLFPFRDPATAQMMRDSLSRLKI